MQQTKAAHPGSAGSPIEEVRETMSEFRKTVLVVEDERKIAQWVETYFEQAGFDVRVAHDGREGLDLARSNLPDLIVLDLNLPSMDGLEVCRRLRRDANPAVAATPIIMVTARVEETDRLTGFSTGADDYVVKPFSPKELVARAQAIFRRLERDLGPKRVLKDGGLVVEPDAHLATLDGEPVPLTPHEFAVLVALMENRGRTLNRTRLVELAFGHEYDGLERTVDAYIRGIRRKIEADPKSPRRIATVYGVGYRYAD
jgi:two-component system alkaline phosphatase synthesis response regulator PhoP